MKTKLFKAIAAGVLALFFLAPTQIKAQVVNPYPIVNNTQCNLTVLYEFYTFDQQTGRCSILCSSGVIAVPPSPPPTFIAHMPPCPQTCGVRITIFAANGMPLATPITAAFNVPPTPPVANGPLPVDCTPTGKLTLNVGPGVAQINP